MSTKKSKSAAKRKAAKAVPTAEKPPTGLDAAMALARLHERAKAVLNALRNFNVTGKENHRAYKLVSADPEWKSGIDYCTRKIIALPGTKSAESDQYAQLRAVWTQIVYRRHGYDATSDKWNAASKAFDKASREFFCFPAHIPSGVLLKVETLRDLEELACEGDTSQSEEDTLRDSREWFAKGIAADLSRIKSHSVQQFTGSKKAALDHLAGAA